MPNYSHGTAGVSATLAAAGVRLGRPDLVEAATRGAEHVISVSETSTGTADSLHRAVQQTGVRRVRLHVVSRPGGDVIPLPGPRGGGRGGGGRATDHGVARGVLARHRRLGGAGTAVPGLLGQRRAVLRLGRCWRGLPRRRAATGLGRRRGRVAADGRRDGGRDRRPRHHRRDRDAMALHRASCRGSAAARRARAGCRAQPASRRSSCARRGSIATGSTRRVSPGPTPCGSGRDARLRNRGSGRPIVLLPWLQPGTRDDGSRVRAGARRDADGFDSRLRSSLPGVVDSAPVEPSTDAVVTR